MPQTVSRLILSGSTNGLGVKVTGTGTGSTVTVHTAVSGSTSYDLVTLWAQNNDVDGETRTLTIEFGGTTDPDNLIIVPVPCKIGPVLVCDGLPLRNSLVVKAFASTANEVVVYGSVLRVTES